MLRSPGLGTVRPLGICTPRMLDAARLSAPRTLGTIGVLHLWRPLSPVGARCLKVPVWQHAGRASETTAAWCVETATASSMHPTTTTKSLHMALRDGQATACNERDPRSHGYHYFSHVLAPSESCLCAGNVSATELFLRLQHSSPDRTKP